MISRLPASTARLQPSSAIQFTLHDEWKRGRDGARRSSRVSSAVWIGFKLTKQNSKTIQWYRHWLDVGAGVVLQHWGDVSQGRVPLHQFLWVGRRSWQRQGVMFSQPLIYLQNVSSGTVHLVRWLLTRDQRPQVLVIQLQKSTTTQRTRYVKIKK